MNTQYVRFNQRMVDKYVTEPSHQRQNCVPLKAFWTYKEPSSSLSDVVGFRWFLSRNGSSLWGFLFQLEGSEIFIFLIVTCLNEPCRSLGSKQTHCGKASKALSVDIYWHQKDVKDKSALSAVCVAFPVLSRLPSLRSHPPLTLDIQEPTSPSAFS